jgi:hypothetical protein
MAPRELDEHPEPGYHPALDELTEQPGPRNTWSWPPPVRAAEWVDVRPLRRDSHTDHREASQPPAHGKPQPGRLSSLAIIGHRLPASSSFVLAAP